MWDDEITSGSNAGDSWCICMWAFADLIEEVGCQNVHIHCDSTDVQYVLDNYTVSEDSNENAHDCLR